MLTIKEIAEMCGMSKTSVNRAISELKIEKIMSGNKNYIAEEDAKRIVSTLCGFGKSCEDIFKNQNKTEQIEPEPIQNQTKTETDTQNDNINPSCSSSSVSSDSDKSNDFLINFLMEQIKVKDNQISELQEENRMLIQAQAYTVKQLEQFTKKELLTTQENKPEAEIIVEEQKKNKKRFLFW